MSQISFSWEPQRRIFTVSELTRLVGELLTREFNDIWVAGEISNTRRSIQGHWYFSLKDKDPDSGLEARIDCVCFRTTALYLRFEPQDGIAVLARGRLDVYPPRGSYQLVVEALEPRGYGALQLAFEQLKKKLAAEGLFDPARKRPLPAFPWRIGIVTSPTGAAIRDMIHILCRRFPGLHIRLFPAQVQGEGSVDDVVRGIEYFARTRWPDVIIVGRGGGSIEDLWTFNEERVARAIAACPIPVVSAVGHETDFTIADFVADLRAPTPSAAAELVVKERAAVLNQVDTYRGRLHRAIRLSISLANQRWHRQGIDRAAQAIHRILQRAGQRLDDLDLQLRERARAILTQARNRHRLLEARLREVDLRVRLARIDQRVQACQQRMIERVRSILAARRRRQDVLASQLAQLSPLRVLERGYAILQQPSGHVVRQASEVQPGDQLNVRLWRGRLRVEVHETQLGTE